MNMYILDLSFVLYKYNVCFQEQKKLLSDSKKEKIEKLIKDIEEILSISVNELSTKLNVDTLKNYIFNTTFPNNIEYVVQLSKNSNLNEKEKLLIKLFKKLIKSFDNVSYDNNLTFDEKDFIKKFLKINDYGAEEPPANSYLTKEKKEDEDDYTVLNLEEYKKNLEELGLPYFEH